jgi:hypothetical protein
MGSNKMLGGRKIIAVSLAILGILFCMPNESLAVPLYQTPDVATITMFVLNSDGSKQIPEALCTSSTAARQSYGCTAYIGDAAHSYPFGNDSTVTVGIESHFTDGTQQGYLHNIVPVEIALTVSSQGNKPLSSVQAQAIAARTFTSYHIQAGSVINNSNEYHVYVPYTYDRLTPEQQDVVNRAVQDRVYLTTANNADAIRAHYGADNAGYTTDGGESYLKSVADPISALYGAPIGTDYGGMSSRGASRWGFGHTSSRGPVAESDPLYPHDNQGNGDFWSVRYDNSHQILVHYYTAIHVRNANQNILTPPYRWNPLTIEGVPAVIDLDTPPVIMVQVQNTGVQTWTCETVPNQQDYFTLRARLESLNPLSSQSEPESITTNRGNVCDLAPGADVRRSVTIDNLASISDGRKHRLRFDIFYDTDYGGPYFWFSEQGVLNWPAYEMEVCVGGCEWIFLPVVLKSL